MAIRTPSESGAPEDDLGVLAERLRSSYRTAEDLTTAFLREAIMSGIFQPGDKLNQDQIARCLGVSRVPVRASLRHLEGERLIIFHPFKGASVAELTESDIRELYEIRALLEAEALAHVANHLTEEDLLRLREEAGHLDPPIGERAEWVTRRLGFYQQLYSLSRRPRLTTLIETLRSEVGPYLPISGMTDDQGGHLRLLELLEQGEVRAAQEWVRSHLADVCDRLCDVVRPRAAVTAPEQPRPSETAG